MFSFVEENAEVIRLYWNLGKDISEKQVEYKYGRSFYATLSHDLRQEMPVLTVLPKLIFVIQNLSIVFIVRVVFIFK